MSLIVAKRPSVLDLRSVVIAVVVLLVGGAIGFGVGYEVKAHRTTTTAKAAIAAAPKATPATGGKATVATAGIAKFRSCLASRGVNYPATTGSEATFATQIAKPPAGVSKATYDNALKACYAANARTKP